MAITGAARFRFMTFFTCFDAEGGVIARCQTREEIAVLQSMGYEVEVEAAPEETPEPEAEEDEAAEDEAVFDALVEALSPLTCDAVSQAASKKVAATIASMR